MLTAHDATGLLWGGHCGGCLEAVWPILEGTREGAVRELVEVRGWELVAGDQIRCVACARRAREVKPEGYRNRRGRRRR